MEALKGQYKRSETLVFRKINDETILVPMKDSVGEMGRILALNEVGSFVWENLDGRNRLPDIRDMMLEEFEVSSEEAGKDLCEFMEQLGEIDAIVQIS